MPDASQNAARPNEDAIYQRLTEIFGDVFMRDDLVLTAELSAADVRGWDSIKQVEILLAIESRFGIRFSTREIDSVKCVGDLARVVMAKAPPARSTIS